MGNAQVITATRQTGKALAPGLPFSLRLLPSVSPSTPKPSEGIFYCRWGGAYCGASLVIRVIAPRILLVRVLKGITLEGARKMRIESLSQVFQHVLALLSRI